MNIARRGIQNQQSLRREYLGIEISECLRESSAGFVRLAQRVHCVRRAQQFPRLLDERIDGLIEHDRANRPRSVGRLGVDQLAQFAARWKGDVIYFGEIVVFTGEPEDGGMGMPRGCGLARSGYGGSGFEWREERA